ncbi:putative clathrin assembly protein At4g40080 [Mercurialis annua]|uniref:putative clathrin assembly protein At4g40080 n=1 Tax=Mercurialis annua TaxID=3986 RepID=UPI00215E753C|nr:putative clathrin assembly protein At4g40080 [Mercurialis annua]
MGQTKKLKILISFLKDKTSIIKTALSAKRHTKIHISILRATTHDASSPPSDHRIAAVLSRSHLSSHDAASTCTYALMNRLHSTKNASVALKCLFIMHVIITKGSFILKDHISINHPSFIGKNVLNLSKFRDGSNSELSSWVKWYATIIEQNMSVSRFLGHYLINKKDKEIQDLPVLSKDLISEIDVLVDFVEVISQVPESLDLQRNNLIYEIVRLVSDDYRLVQREIFIRILELGEKITSLSYSELTQFLGNLKQIENCRERLRLLLVNRNRNDSLWESLSEIKIKSEEMIVEKGKIKLLKMESTKYSSQLNSGVDDWWNWTRFS